MMVRCPVSVRWRKLVSQKCKFIHPLVINPQWLRYFRLGQSCSLLTRSAPGAGSWVWETRGVEVCTSGHFIPWQASARQARLCGPLSILGSPVPIDNSHSMNGVTRRRNSRADICASRPSMEGSNEDRDNDRLLFDVSLSHNSLKTLTVSVV